MAGALPHRFLYGPVAAFVCFVLHRVARYRLRVVRDNLSSSFPERTTGELRAIERGFYRNLAEYFIDAADMAGLSEGGHLRRCPWPDDNRAKVLAETAGRNWIALTAHFGSWEWFGTFGLYREGPVTVAAYRPLRNRAFDLYYKWARSLPPRIVPVPSGEMLRFFATHRDGIDGSPLSLVLIADQSPPLDAQSRWVPFLNHPTVFFHGGEKIARKFGLPVYYLRMRKTGRGTWETTFEQIWDGVSPTSDHEITGRYARLLEEDIRREPALWLWSHRRWKRRPEGDAAREYFEKYGRG
jgi:KDO2-lipid IV(A) lauroyltransferase